MRIDWEYRVASIINGIFNSVYCEYIDGIWTKEEAIGLLKNWKAKAKQLIPAKAEERKSLIQEINEAHSKIATMLEIVTPGFMQCYA